MTLNTPAVQSKDTTILLVDDNALTRSVLRTILRQDGYHAIREASEAKSGLQLAQHFRPDVICLDVHMPVKSGLELLAELKASVPTTPVLMITASNDAETVRACVEGHAAGYILKPFSAETLLKTIEGVITKARRARAGKA
jgi:two-component system chemotaxis response regulator CheY